MLKVLAASSVLIPILGSLGMAALWGLKEQSISRISRSLLGLTLFSAFSLLVAFLFSSGPIASDFGVLYRQNSYSFPITLAVDGPACLYLLLTTVLAAVTIKYSRYYLHRERGYRRYFSLILLMVGGSNLLALAGTLDLLFAGWELIALSSFLLIGFYWNRRQPARNSLLAFIVYRICDVGLLAGTMLTHVLWTDGDRFLALGRSATRISEYAQGPHGWILAVTAGMLILASLGKSAQFPFLNWLPRALEGPTPSSAIFYGALSVHAGVFLLLRTEPIWSQYLGFRAAIAAIGLISAILATVIGRTLSNIKGQIAYAAIAQVGVIFIELALGWYSLALAHLALHSFLRAYQILISPSIVAHALRAQSSIAQPQSFMAQRILRLPTTLLQRHQATLYRLSLADFYLWPSRTATPSLAKRLRQLARATLGRSAGSAWLRIGIYSVVTFAICFWLDPHTALSAPLAHYAFFLIAWIIGWLALGQRRRMSLSEHHGLLGSSPFSALLVLISVLIITGMPLSPSFISEDLLLHWSFERSPLVSAAFAVTLALLSISAARVFTRIYFGRPHEK